LTTAEGQVLRTRLGGREKRDKGKKVGLGSRKKQSWLPRKAFLKKGLLEERIKGNKNTLFCVTKKLEWQGALTVIKQSRK